MKKPAFELRKRLKKVKSSTTKVNRNSRGSHIEGLWVCLNRQITNRRPGRGDQVLAVPDPSHTKNRLSQLILQRTPFGTLKTRQFSIKDSAGAKHDHHSVGKYLGRNRQGEDVYDYTVLRTTLKTQIATLSVEKRRQIVRAGQTSDALEMRGYLIVKNKGKALETVITEVLGGDPRDYSVGGNEDPPESYREWRRWVRAETFNAPRAG